MENEQLPSFDLSGLVVFVTGAARGIGRACALASAQAGADVILGLRDQASGQQLASEIARMGRRALAVQMDVTDLDQIRSAVASAAREFGRIDVLVNNAGLGPENPPRTSGKRTSI
jgi:NAD(P)-dependent dehydrogenase (short-subunit alcohol dehydrogenase family)